MFAMRNVRPVALLYTTMYVFLACGRAASTAPKPKILCFIATTSHHYNSILPSTHQRHMRKSVLFLSQNNNDGGTSKSARERGIYSRPSAAIERGSGFFIPGLEGPRIRLLFGITVLISDAINHFLAESQPGDVGQIIAESTAAFYGALLLLQGLIESGGVRKTQEIDTSVGEGNVMDIRFPRKSIEIFADELKSTERVFSAVQKVAQTIINFTPTRYILLANDDAGVLYSLSTSNDTAETISSKEQRELIELALDAVSKSRGGRVALPSDHPVSKLLSPSTKRCILVQKLNFQRGGCLIMGSDTLLPSFTKNDLRWIGQLGETIKP